VSSAYGHLSPEAVGEKRIAIERLLAAGLRDHEIVARVACSRTYVVGVRKALGLDRDHWRLAMVERIEQAIAWGHDNARVAADLGVPVEQVAKVRDEMNVAAEEDVDRDPPRRTTGVDRYRARQADVTADRRRALVDRLAPRRRA
jgi:hypothetical protein